MKRTLQPKHLDERHREGGADNRHFNRLSKRGNYPKEPEAHFVRERASEGDRPRSLRGVSTSQGTLQLSPPKSKRTERVAPKRRGPQNTLTPPWAAMRLQGRIPLPSHTSQRYRGYEQTTPIPPTRRC